MHAYDKRPSEGIIEKILGEKLIEKPVVDVQMLDTFIDNIMNYKDADNADSSDEDPIVRQENIKEDFINISNDIPQEEGYKSVETSAKTPDGENDNEENKSKGKKSMVEEAEEESQYEDPDIDKVVLMEEEFQEEPGNVTSELDKSNNDVAQDVPKNLYNMLETESPT